MPLLEMKSDLSKINTNFGSDTTTAGNTDNFPYSSLNDWPPLNSAFIMSSPPNTINFDWRGRQTPISDYVSGYALPITATTTTTTSTLQALTQEEMDTLGDMEGDAGFAGGIAPVVVTLTQPLTTSSPLLPYNPDIAPPSKLLNLHIEGREIDFGFTRRALPLESYYAQLTEDKGILGIRNDNIGKLGSEQPFVIREIGDRWGIDKVQRPDNLGDFVQIGLNFMDQLGGAVLGRDPSVFIDRYFADVTRLTGVANPAVSVFAEAQAILQRRNKFDAVTTVKYGFTEIPSITIDDPLSAFVEGQRLLLDPQVYNPASIYSIPGITGMMFNRMGIIDIQRFRHIGAAALIGIAGVISIKALEFVQEVGTRFIRDIRPIATPIKNAARGVIKGIKGSKFIRDVDEKTQGVQDFLGNTADYVEKKGQHFRDKAQAFAGDVSDAYSKISKGKAVQLDPRVFEDTKVDKVNLIPYGSDEYKGDKVEDLDWIPFKFFDVHGTKPIVFRALLSGITDTFSPEYAEERYVGRPDSVYVYQGTKREISFTFDIYPKSDAELVTLWEKMNYLAGLTYPHWENAAGGGKGMVAPICQLTIGQMYTDTPGYISSLTYTVQDTGTWEVTFAKLPKYIQANCTFVYIGSRLPSATQKHYELPWVGEEQYVSGITGQFLNMLNIGKQPQMDLGNLLETSPDFLASFLEK